MDSKLTVRSTPVCFNRKHPSSIQPNELTSSSLLLALGDRKTADIAQINWHEKGMGEGSEGLGHSVALNLLSP